jgi:histidine triad (HIT) family protein
MADQCLFCRIAAGEVPAKLVYEGDDLVAFRDINPQAPTHILIVPRRHIASVNELEEGDAELVGRLFLTARELAEMEGISGSGYRLVMNTGPAAGQTVDHIHLHLLGGRSMHWPPG